MVNYNIKLAHKGQNRRFLLTREQCGYEELQQLTNTSFPDLPLPHSFQYTDDEGDVITASSGPELGCALAVMESMGTTVFKFEVVNTDASPSGDTAKPCPCPSDVHRGIICDECNCNPISGVRYKCMVRHDFDLCAQCEHKVAAQPFPMMKIYTPEQRQYLGRSPGCRWGRPQHFTSCGQKGAERQGSVDSGAADSVWPPAAAAFSSLLRSIGEACRNGEGMKAKRCCSPQRKARGSCCPCPEKADCCKTGGDSAAPAAKTDTPTTDNEGKTATCSNSGTKQRGGCCGQKGGQECGFRRGCGRGGVTAKVDGEDLLVDIPLPLPTDIPMGVVSALVDEFLVGGDAGCRGSKCGNPAADGGGCAGGAQAAQARASTSPDAAPAQPDEGASSSSSEPCPSAPPSSTMAQEEADRALAQSFQSELALKRQQEHDQEEKEWQLVLEQSIKQSQPPSEAGSDDHSQTAVDSVVGATPAAPTELVSGDDEEPVSAGLTRGAARGASDAGTTSSAVDDSA